jgi:colanic acid biosynthesis glycosyl transferase WcaI
MKRKSTPSAVICCQVFYPDEQATSQLLSPVLRMMAIQGLNLRVLSGFPAVLSGASRVVSSEEVWEGLSIRRLGVRNSVKGSLAARLLTYGSYSLGVMLSLLFGRSGTRVLVVTNPPFLPILVVAVGCFRRLRVKVMLQDIYPDGLVAVGTIRARGWVDTLWAKANHWAFHRCQEVWVLGRDMAELVSFRYGVCPSRIRVIPHWSPIEFPRRTLPGDSRLWADQGLGGRFVVQYSGNMGLWHDLISIVRAAALLRNDAQIVFLLIGAGRCRAAAEEEAQKLGLRNIRWLPYQPQEVLADTLSCCHLALVSQRAGLEGVAVPCKLYGILASGRAVVAQVPERSEVARVVAEEGCGVVVPPGDAAALALHIRRLSQAPTEVDQMGERAFAAYHAKYTLEAGMKAFAEGFKYWGLEAASVAEERPAEPV